MNSFGDEIYYNIISLSLILYIKEHKHVYNKNSPATQMITQESQQRFIIVMKCNIVIEYGYSSSVKGSSPNSLCDS